MPWCLKYFIHALGHEYRISSAMTPKEVSPVANANCGFFGQALTKLKDYKLPLKRLNLFLN